MAHSWIQSFDDELEAFRAYAKIFPDSCTLLVDTYDTLKSGIPNAIKVARELRGKGHQLVGIRLDSGDLSYLSKKAREMLDESGLEEVKIVASNQLDETIIQSLLSEGAPIDVFGVGTSIATGKDDAALDGVYKLSFFDGKPSIKVSENLSKMTLPGIKRIDRFIDEENQFCGDGIALNHEDEYGEIYHPTEAGKQKKIALCQKESLIHQVMQNGRSIYTKNSPKIIAAYTKSQLQRLPKEHKRFLNPHVYKVGISKELLNTRNNLAKDYLKRDPY